MPRRIGHRGAKGYAPENTISSFERAIELGCDEIETDVWLFDGRLVISHDRPVTPRTLLLEDAIAACRGRVVLDVEVKASRDEAAARETGARTAALIRERGGRDEAYVSSFWLPALEGARAAAPEVRRAYIYASYEGIDDLVARARQLALWALHPAHAYVTPELVRAAHAAGLVVNTWTANEPDDIAALVALGVDGIASDFPDRVPKSPA